jgi:hypothetical protein
MSEWIKERRSHGKAKIQGVPDRKRPKINKKT